MGVPTRSTGFHGEGDQGLCLVKVRALSRDVFTKSTKGAIDTDLLVGRFVRFPGESQRVSRNLDSASKLGVELRRMGDRHCLETPRQEDDSIGTLIVRIGLDQVAIPANPDQVIRVNPVILATHPKDRNAFGPTQ